MPDTVINAGQPLRFEQGGVLRLEDIEDGDTPYAVVNRDKGTVQMEDGWYEPLRYNDRGQMQVPIEGDERPSTLRATVKLTSADATELITLSQQLGASGLMRLWRVILEFPAFKGSGDKHIFTLEGAYFVKPIQVQEGQEFDTVTIEMESPEAKWAPTFVEEEE